MFLIDIFLSLLLNIIYYVISQKIKTTQFMRYFVGFSIYTLFIFIILFFLNTKFINVDFIPFLVLYILFFISLFLSMSTKYIKSPTYLIFQSLKKGKNKSEIILFLKKNKVFEIRIKDLINQNIILKKNNRIHLKKNISIVLKLILTLKKFLKLKAEG